MLSILQGQIVPRLSGFGKRSIVQGDHRSILPPRIFAIFAPSPAFFQTPRLTHAFSSRPGLNSPPKYGSVLARKRSEITSSYFKKRVICLWHTVSQTQIHSQIDTHLMNVRYLAVFSICMYCVDVNHHLRLLTDDFGPPLKSYSMAITVLKK